MFFTATLRRGFVIYKAMGVFHQLESVVVVVVIVEFGVDISHSVVACSTPNTGAWDVKNAALGLYSQVPIEVAEQSYICAIFDVMMC